MNLKSCSLVALAVAALVITPLAKADHFPSQVSASIVVDSQNSNPLYQYDLNINTNTDDGGLDVKSFTLTGLAGITNAVLIDDLKDDFNVTFTSTSVTVTDSDGSPWYDNGSFGDLKVYSNYAPGTVHYSISDDCGNNYNGDVTGPVAPAVPEPTSLVLFGSGILGLAGAVRRKLGA